MESIPDLEYIISWLVFLSVVGVEFLYAPDCGYFSSCGLLLLTFGVACTHPVMNCDMGGMLGRVNGVVSVLKLGYREHFNC